jgi:hypothetical protein
MTYALVTADDHNTERPILLCDERAEADAIAGELRAPGSQINVVEYRRQAHDRGPPLGRLSFAGRQQPHR